MNKTFKTLWNDVRRCYIVANEAQKSHGKPSKSAVAVAVAATAFLSAGIANAYVDPGKLGSKSSWETKEYGTFLPNYSSNLGEGSQHGLTHINASTAYAEGYTGKGVVIGVVDSGALLAHPELSGGRIYGVTATGNYHKDGTRYPFAGIGQSGGSLNETGEYQKGESFETNGDWILGHNDSHGTHVTTVVAGNRNNEYSHGVAFDADVAVGNTGGTDNMNYGPYQDYNYFYAVWDAVGATGAKVINNSWGTNIRVGGNTDTHFNVGVMSPDDEGEPEPGTVADPGGSEDEYFLFMEDAEANGGKNFMDAAYDVAAKYGLIQIFTNGNRHFQNPYYRAAYAYYNPEAEKYWIAAGGVDVDADGNEMIMGWGKTYRGTGVATEGGNTYNRAGIAKWWGIAAPTNVMGARVDAATGEASINQAGGTSNAAPHIAGAMGVLLQRFGTYMDATQVRDVMFTTARQTQLNNPDELLPGISKEEFGAPEDDYGWGIVDLGKAIYGPGQFFGTFDVTMNNVDDQWDNAITENAIVLRGKEDANEKKTLASEIAELQARKATLTDKERWELEYKEKRLAAIQQREIQGYVGKLIKRGNGTLVMTAVNNYSGGTEIHAGKVAGLTESFGSGAVTVKQGAAVELHQSFDVTHAGETDWVTTTVTGTTEAGDDAKIVLENGSTLALASSGINIQSLKVGGKATVAAAGFSADQLASLWAGETASLEVSANVADLQMGQGAELVAGDGYALFEGGAVNVEGSTISTSLTKGDKTVASFGSNGNASAIGAAIESAAASAVMGDLLAASSEQLGGTLASLSNDFHLAAQNATIVNAASMSRMIKDQANAYGEARRAELENGATLWAAGMGSWSNVDAGGASVDMDVDYYAGFIGAELPYGDRNKVGVFFGYGLTDYDAGSDGDMDSDDIHIGMYGENDWDAFGLTYGFAYTTQDREGKQSFSFLDQVTHNSIDYNATVFQIFGEASWKGFNTESYQVEPYVGLSWLNVKADDFTGQAGGHAVKTEIEDQNLGMANVGVRGALPFTAGSIAMKVRADVGYAQFFGDKEATARITVGDAGTASIKGEELSGMGMVGLGLDASIGKNATFGVSYTGAFGSDITSHGVGAKLGIKF